MNYLTAHRRKTPPNFTRLIWLASLVLASFLVSACGTQPLPTSSISADTPSSTPSRTSPTRTGSPAIPTPISTITPQPTSSLGIKPADLEGTSLIFWHPWSGETRNAIQESLSAFNTTNPYGITVEVVPHENLNSLYDRIEDTGFEAGLPNLAVASNYQIQSWISADKPVAGLDTYFSDPDWGISAQEQADINQLFLGQDVRGGSRFGMPAVRNAQLLYYNTTWAEELGFDSPPGTPDEFRDQACAAARANQNNESTQDDGTGGWLINTAPSAFLSWLFAFDSPVVLPDERGYRFNTPASEAALEFLKGLFDEGCAFEVLESPPEVHFADRQALFITAALSDTGYQNSEFARLENGDDWTVIGFPAPGGEPVISVYGPSYFIFAGTPQENLAAWLVVKWLLSPEQDARVSGARGTFLLNNSSLDLLDDYAVEHPQWTAAQALLAGAVPEPGLESWGRVRWILGDVGTQIFRYYFTADRIAATLELMDETAAELHNLEN
jgi:multiple sugar transport system substrate-binding protein